MSSKTEICNLALTRLSATRITNFDTDSTVEAKDCRAVYDLATKYTMGLGEWPSVRRRSTLAQLSESPAFEFTYAYQLPTDPKFLRLISINDFKPGDIEYTIEGDQLLCNESSVAIRYLAFITDANSYDVDLEEAIVDRLTAELVLARSGQVSTYKAALDYAMKHAKELLSRAGVGSKSAIYINSDTFIDARNDNWPIEGRLRD